MVTSNVVVLPGFSLKLDLENSTDAYCIVNGTGPMFNWMEFYDLLGGFRSTE